MLCFCPWLQKLILKCSNVGSLAPTLLFHLLTFSPKFFNLENTPNLPTISIESQLPLDLVYDSQEKGPGDLRPYHIPHTEIRNLAMLLVICCLPELSSVT